MYTRHMAAQKHRGLAWGCFSMLDALGELENQIKQISALQAKARCQMAEVDMLLVPTALHHYTIQEIYLEERNPDKVRVV